MKKKGKTVCQIIRFRGKIEAFFVSIDEFAISNFYTTNQEEKIGLLVNQWTLSDKQTFGIIELCWSGLIAST